MMRRIIAGDMAEFERNMVLGLSRSQGPADDPLRLVALVGSRLKCSLPQLPNVKPASPDSYTTAAPYLSPDARTLAVKLLGGKDGLATDGIARAVSRAIAAAGFCLHPFDYASLESFIAGTAAERTGPERAWLERVRPNRSVDDDPYADGAATEDKLPRLGKTAKLQFVRDLRRHDAGHARQVMESLWANEPANMRADLLRLLHTNLSPEDRQFLEGLSGDRAQSVREMAAALLARIAGTQAFAGRMAALKHHIQITTTGLLRRTKVLKFKGAGKTGTERDGEEEQRQLLDGLRITDVAGALGETPPTLLAAAEASEQASLLPLLLLQLAATEGLIDLVERHQKILDGQNAITMLGFIEQVVSELDPQHIERFLSVAIRPGPIWTSSIPEFGNRLYAALGRPLPATAAALVIAQCGTADRQTERSLQAFLDAIAPLIPVSQSAAFIATFEQQSRRATLYHRLLPLLPPLHR